MPIVLATSVSMRSCQNNCSISRHCLEGKARTAPRKWSFEGCAHLPTTSGCDSRLRCSWQGDRNAPARGGVQRVVTFAPCNLRRSEEHTSELQSPYDLVCRFLLE